MAELCIPGAVCSEDIGAGVGANTGAGAIAGGIVKSAGAGPSRGDIMKGVGLGASACGVMAVAGAGAGMSMRGAGATIIGTVGPAANAVLDERCFLHYSHHL